MTCILLERQSYCENRTFLLTKILCMGLKLYNSPILLIKNIELYLIAITMGISCFGNLYLLEVMSDMTHTQLFSQLWLHSLDLVMNIQ